MWKSPEQTMDPTQMFEKGRIRGLQEERIRVQKKTFTKWINFHLKPTGMQVDDLFQDIKNGRMLHQLLQVHRLKNCFSFPSSLFHNSKW